MKHPSNEEWISHLYGETSRSAGRLLDQHLRDCDNCRARWENWQRCQTFLGRTIVPSRADKIWHSTRWAAAACLVLCLTYLAGYHLGQKQTAPTKLMAELRQEMLRELPLLQEEELSNLRLDLESRLAEQTQKTEQVIATVRHEAAAGRRQLRLELETVALIGESRYQISQNPQQVGTPSLRGLPTTFTSPTP